MSRGRSTSYRPPRRSISRAGSASRQQSRWSAGSGGGGRGRQPVGAPRKRAKDRQGVALIVASIAVALGIGVAMAALQPKPYDEATLCPSETLPQRTLVLVDRSDALIGPDRVRRLIESAESKLPVHGRLSVYQIGQDGGTIGDAMFDLCNPGRGAQVSPIYRNPRRVQEFYEEQFRGPLDAVLTEITRPIEAPTSPIAESIAALLKRADDDYGAETAKLIVVSDFLQNTQSIGSAYSKGPPLQQEAAIALLESARGERAATIEAYVMQRARLAPTQENLRREFWNPVFGQAGLSVDWR